MCLVRRHTFILSLGNQYFSLILIYVIYTFILNVNFCIVCAVQLPLLPESQSFRSFLNKFSKKMFISYLSFHTHFCHTHLILDNL